MIYLLEDDDSIRDFVIYTLNSQGMEARGFPLPSLFWQAVGEQMPALVLLDIMLPEEDGPVSYTHLTLPTTERV